MAKKIFTGILGVFLVVFGAVCVFADDLPEVTEETKVYVKFGGNDQADGLTPDTAKATLGQLNGSGAVSLLKNGGTLVTNGKIVVGGNYVLPELDPRCSLPPMTARSIIWARETIRWVR